MKFEGFEVLVSHHDPPSRNLFICPTWSSSLCTEVNFHRFRNDPVVESCLRDFNVAPIIYKRLHYLPGNKWQQQF